MNPKRVRDFVNYFFGYVIVWMIAVFIFVFLRHYAQGENHQFSILDLEIINGIGTLIILGAIFGFMFVMTDFILRNKWIRKNSYATTILIAIVIHSATFYITIFFVILFLDPIYSNQYSDHIIRSVFTSGNMWVAFFFFNLVIVFLNIEQYVRKIFGPGVMMNIILGKYYKPRNEERIFMFVDLVSSTTYAEKLGSLKFIGLIQDCFHDVSSIVEKYDAEIYQYVGDQVILTWTAERGRWKNNAFNSFFAFVDLLDRKSDYYSRKYDILPKFKAGIHFGIASVGEVGEIKKEIAFLGDAVNISARLLGVCNQYKAEFLASGEMVKLAANSNTLKFEFLDEVVLKGKQSPTKIYNVKKL